MPLSLGLIEDNRTDQLIFEHLVQAQADLCVGAMFESGEEALKALEPWRADTLLVDLQLPGISGPKLVQSLRRKWPRLPVIVWTGAADADSLQGCIRAGARGYLLKSHASAAESQRFAEHIREVVGGGYCLDKGVYRYLFEQASRTLPALSRRERQVLELTRAGLRNKEIASALGLSEDTVDQYAASARKKADALSTVEAIYAYRI